MKSLNSFKEKLEETIKKDNIDHFLIHTDGSRAPFHPKAKKPADKKREYVLDIENLTHGVNYSLVCFNYDFLKTGVYSVKDSECQVGAINEFIRKQDPEKRTLTPVFSHTYRDDIDFYETLDECDPFSEASFYGFLHRKNSMMLHYGSGLEHTTLIHYAERIGKQLLYRYDKVFNGNIETFDSKIISTKLVYHVRPKGVSLVYDWERLNKDLIRAGIMHQWHRKLQRISFYKIDELLEYWLMRFAGDPYYFLDENSRTVLESNVERLGRKLLITDFE